MSDMLPINPDLQQPGQDARVLPRARFRNVDDDGRVVESTAPLPALFAKEVKYYASSVPTASFHRTDGKRLGFVHGILETKLHYDQLYLDNEIADGNPYLVKATDEQIRAHKYRLNPKETMKAELLSDPEVKQQLTDQIMAELVRNAAPGSALAQELDRLRLAGVDTGLEKKEEKLDIGTGTLTPSGGAEAASRLGGIVNSSHIAAAALGK